MLPMTSREIPVALLCDIEMILIPKRNVLAFTFLPLPHLPYFFSFSRYLDRSRDILPVQLYPKRGHWARSGDTVDTHAWRNASREETKGTTEHLTIHKIFLTEQKVMQPKTSIMLRLGEES